MASNLAVQDKNGMQALLEGARSSMLAVLPKTLTPERLIKVAMIAAAKQPKLYECTKMSLLQSIMLGAELGLEAGGPLGHLWLVPFRNKGVMTCTPIIGYQGYVELAFRSERVQSLEARVVYENDEYDVSFGRELKLVHKPCLHGEKGEPVFVYSVAHTTNGGVTAEVMSVDDVEKIRARSRAKDDGPWITDWGPMACKTVFRRHSKWLPKSVELSRALSVDEEQERSGEDFDMDLVPGAAELEPAEAKPSRTQNAKDKVRQRVEQPEQDYDAAEVAEAQANLEREPGSEG